MLEGLEWPQSSPVVCWIVHAVQLCYEMALAHGLKRRPPTKACGCCKRTDAICRKTAARPHSVYSTLYCIVLQGSQARGEQSALLRIHPQFDLSHSHSAAAKVPNALCPTCNTLTIPEPRGSNSVVACRATWSSLFPHTSPPEPRSVVNPRVEDSLETSLDSYLWQLYEA